MASATATSIGIAGQGESAATIVNTTQRLTAAPRCEPVLSRRKNAVKQMAKKSQNRRCCHIQTGLRAPSSLDRGSLFVIRETIATTPCAHRDSALDSRIARQREWPLPSSWSDCDGPPVRESIDSSAQPGERIVAARRDVRPGRCRASHGCIDHRPLDEEADYASKQALPRVPVRHRHGRSAHLRCAVNRPQITAAPAFQAAALDLSRTTPARCGTAAATASPRPTRPAPSSD